MLLSPSNAHILSRALLRESRAGGALTSLPSSRPFVVARGERQLRVQPLQPVQPGLGRLSAECLQECSGYASSQGPLPSHFEAKTPSCRRCRTPAARPPAPTGRTCFSPEPPSQESPKEHAGCSAVCKVTSQVSSPAATHGKGRAGEEAQRRENLEWLFWP